MTEKEIAKLLMSKAVSGLCSLDGENLSAAQIKDFIKLSVDIGLEDEQWEDPFKGMSTEELRKIAGYK